MIAVIVLLSVGALLALLVHGRWGPALLFTAWAGAYFLFGLVSETELLSSYSNPALISLMLLLTASLALERCPILDRMSSAILKGRHGWALFKFSGTTAFMSAWINNTAVVAALMPVVSRQRRIPASKLLMPLSFASIVGGVTTLVGTSTNLVVSSMAVGAGLEPIGMFQMSTVGVPLAIGCILVMVLSARLLPSHPDVIKAPEQGYFLEAGVQPDSPLVGRTVEANRLRNLEGLFLVELVRAGRLISPLRPEEVIQAHDVLVFTGEVQRVQGLQRFHGLRIFGARPDALLGSNLVEAVISSQSDLANRTLREVDFRAMFDAGVVGIRRGDQRLQGQLGRIPLRVGDALLLAVGGDFRQNKNVDRNFHLVSEAPVRANLDSVQSALTVGGFMGVIALAALELVPLLSGLLVLLFVLLGTGILDLEEVRRRFPFGLFMMIGSALVIAKVIENSGAAKVMADFIRGWTDGQGAWGALVAVYLLTVVLTELLTNNAAAALAFPVALSTARAVGVDPTPFVMVVAFGASAGFLIPFGYQTHLMVYSPGHYKTTDFLRYGLAVSLVYGLAVVLLTPIAFPLRSSAGF